MPPTGGSNILPKQATPSLQQQVTNIIVCIAFCSPQFKDKELSFVNLYLNALPHSETCHPIVNITC